MDVSRNGRFNLGHATLELPPHTSVDSRGDVGQMIRKLRLRALGSPYSLGIIYTEGVGDLEP